MKLLKISILAAFVSFFGGCKEQVRTTIPNVPVSLDLNILRDAPQLTATGGVATFVVPRYARQYLGYGGVVVFHNFEDRFVAYDLACPHEIEPTIRVNVDSIPGEAICPVCGTIFEIGYSRGYPISGPCKYPLRQYSVMISNEFDLRIFN